MQTQTPKIIEKRSKAHIDSIIKTIIAKVLRENALLLVNVILFGSRARGESDINSDYDLLVIIDDQLEMKNKIEITEAMRTELAKLLISTDIILKSQKEAGYYKDKIGSVVREALKEGIPL